MLLKVISYKKFANYFVNAGLRNNGKKYLYNKTLNILLVIIISLFFLNGCLPLLVAGTAAGGGVAYMMADLEEIVDSSPDKIQEASEKALDDLGIHLISSAATKIDAKVTGRTATDKKVTVIAKERGENRSFVTIRVGLAGDQSLSRRILDSILDNI